VPLNLIRQGFIFALRVDDILLDFADVRLSVIHHIAQGTKHNPVDDK
jgi:hypothetical protein